MDAPKHRRKAGPSALNSADPRRNFSLSVDERIRALTIGAPAWATRKRKIEDEVERIVSELVELHDALLADERTSAEIDAHLETAANAFDLPKLNGMVATHNRYYPIEANLPMNQHGYTAYGRPWRPEASFTPERLVTLARAFIAERSEESD